MLDEPFFLVSESECDYLFYKDGKLELRDSSRGESAVHGLRWRWCGKNEVLFWHNVNDRRDEWTVDDDSFVEAYKEAVGRMVVE